MHKLQINRITRNTTQCSTILQTIFTRLSVFFPCPAFFLERKMNRKENEKYLEWDFRKRTGTTPVTPNGRAPFGLPDERSDTIVEGNELDGLRRSALHRKETATRGRDSVSIPRILRVFHATEGEHRDLAPGQLLRPSIPSIHPLNPLSLPSPSHDPSLPSPPPF